MKKIDKKEVDWWRGKVLKETKRCKNKILIYKSNLEAFNKSL